MHVAVIGEVFVDERWDAGGMRAFVGGGALAAAARLRRDGHTVTLVTALGADVRGAWLRAGIASYGVALVAVPARGGSGHALNGRITTRAQLVMVPPVAADAVLEIDAPAALARADHAVSAEPGTASEGEQQAALATGSPDAAAALSAVLNVDRRPLVGERGASAVHPRSLDDTPGRLWT